MAVHYLDWDSKFFGHKVGSLTLNAGSSLGATLQQANQENYKLIYVYSGCVISQLIHESYCLLDVGGQVSFCKKPLPPLGELESESHISLYRRLPLSSRVCALLFLSGRLSRFSVDPRISSAQFEKLYETWLVKTMLRYPFGLVNTYQIDDDIVGLLSADWNGSVCSVGLLAVLEKAQGNGIATKLVRHIEQFCLQKGIRSLQVKTQLSNHGARALYLRCGFVEQKRTLLYHAHCTSDGT